MCNFVVLWMTCVSLSLSLCGLPSLAGCRALAEVGAQGRQDCCCPDPWEECRPGGTGHAGLSELGCKRKHLCTKHQQLLQIGSALQQLDFDRLIQSRVTTVGIIYLWKDTTIVQVGEENSGRLSEPHRLEVPEILSAEKVLASGLLTHPLSALPVLVNSSCSPFSIIFSFWYCQVWEVQCEIKK